MIEYFASPVKDVTSKAEMKMTTGAKMEYVKNKTQKIVLNKKKWKDTKQEQKV